jgi:hypothetical protein
MKTRFTKHYTREEASALIPQLRRWLEQVNGLRHELGRCDKRISGLRAAGEDLGGDLVGRWIKTIAEVKLVVDEFQRREIVIKDIERGLLDFPAIIGGREVFLCWEKDEEKVEFWHELDAGYAGRERL